MLRKTVITALLAPLCFALCAAAQEYRQTLSIVLDQNPAAQAEAPLAVKKPADNVRVDWVEMRGVGSQIPAAVPKSAHVYYSRTPNGGDISKYTRVSVMETDNASASFAAGVSKNYIRFVPAKNGIGAGAYYCIVAYTEGGATYYSNYFELKVASAAAPALRDPKGLLGAAKVIDELTPAFSWNPVGGVPYYHIILSDESIPLANIIGGGKINFDFSIVWQAITPNTRITYGAPDPSNTVTAAPPPLSPGKEYTWFVLNNYGNHTAFSDGNAVDIPGVFRISGRPLRAPRAVSPNNRAESGDMVRFTWTNLDTAAGSYLVNLFMNADPKELGVGGLSQLENANTSASMLVWETTVPRAGKKQNESLSADLLNAKGTLTGGDYIWRVYALDSRGAASTDSTSRGAFKYQGVPSGTVAVKTMEMIGAAESRVGYVELKSEVVSGPMQAPIAFYTLAGGYHERDFPEGTYRITAIKDGYNTQTVTFSIRGGSTTPVNIYMKRPDAVIYGRVAGPDSAWVNQAKVTAASEWGDTVTALTNAGGNFTINCREADWTVTVEKAGYGSPRPAAVTLRPGDDSNLGTLYLAKHPHTLSGTVRNSDGVPIIGVRVRVLREGVLVDEFASTPQNGAYSFSLPSGAYTLTAEKAGFVMYGRSVELAGSRNHDITMAGNAALVTGAVFGRSWNAAWNNGAGRYESAPIPNARVTFTGAPDTFTVTGDATFGKFSLSVPGGRKFAVTSEAGGFVSTGRGAGSVTTVSGTAHTYFDTLQALAMISGKTVDANGSPTAGVDVIVYDTSANEAAASAKSSSDGAFEIRNIPNGKYIVNAGRSGYYLLNAGELAGGLEVTGGKPSPSRASYALTMGVGRNRIKWNVAGYAGKGSIKVTSPLNKTIPFSTAGGSAVTAALDSAGPGDYVIEAVAESDPALLQMSYHKFNVPDNAAEFSNTVRFPFRYTRPDTVSVDDNGDISLTVNAIDDAATNRREIYYRSEGSTQYKRAPASNGYTFKLKPDRDAGGLQYYFRIELSNGDVYGSAKQVFTSYVMPDNTVISRVSVEPGSSGDTLYLPSSYRTSFTFNVFYSDLFIPLGETDNAGNVAWSVSGEGASVSGSGRAVTLATRAGSAGAALTAKFTPRPPYAMKAGRDSTVIIPIKVTGSALESVAVVRNGGLGPLPNTENANFRVEALDKNGKPVTVSPQWSVMPESGGRIAGGGTFEPKQDFFGVARVYASAGGMTAEYREDGANLPGLNVNYTLRNKNAPDTASTHRGLKLAFAANSIPAGESVELRAVIHSIGSDLKNSIHKGSGAFRMADSLAYDVEFSTADKIDSTVSIIIDIPAHLRSRAAGGPDNFKIARWHTDSLMWIELPSSGVISGGAAAAAKLRSDADDALSKNGASKQSRKSSAAAVPPAAASKLYASARYAIVARSVSFSVGLTVSPNPFSPYIRPVKEYGRNKPVSEVPAGTRFKVDVEAAESFVKSVEVHVYNAVGKRVWAVEKLGSEVGETVVWWDGRAAERKVDYHTYEQNMGKGRMCRNGRYFVTAIVTDVNNKQKRVMKPLVMMK